MVKEVGLVHVALSMDPSMFLRRTWQVFSNFDSPAALGERDAAMRITILLALVCQSPSLNCVIMPSQVRAASDASQRSY